MEQFSSRIAYNYLSEAQKTNSGPWIMHSVFAGKAARSIAEKLPELDADLAEAYGYIHDIGRRFGRVKMRHIIDGYRFLETEGYPEAAKICLTHSFPAKDIENVVEGWDCSEEEYLFAKKFVQSVEFTPYDELIQLCDFLAMPTGCSVIERRMVDISIRHCVNEGAIKNWKTLLLLQNKIEEKLGYSIYELIPGVQENILKKPIKETMKYTFKEFRSDFDYNFENLGGQNG